MAMKTLALACTASAASLSWDEWKNEYGKNYAGDEEVVRQQIFEANVKEIDAHNAKNLSWKMDVNQFTDLSTDEFIAQYTGEVFVDEDVPLFKGDELEENLADSIDWVSKGVVNQVKDQGSCGSCWTFAATSTVESSYALATGNLHDLAEQALVDCLGSDGCNGGSRDTGISHHAQKGSCLTSSYPYKAQYGSCQENSCQKAVNPGEIAGAHDITASASSLMSALNSQPVSISVKANSFQHYSSGVLQDPCNKRSHNHAITAVGYGTDSGTAYFKVRNSWGSKWGEQGYIRMAQTGGDYGTSCMFSSKPSYAAVSASDVTV